MKMSSKSVTGTRDAGDPSVTISADEDGRVDLYLGFLSVLTAAVITGKVTVGVRMRFDKAA